MKTPQPVMPYYVLGENSVKNVVAYLDLVYAIVLILGAHKKIEIQVVPHDHGFH